MISVTLNCQKVTAFFNGRFEWIMNETWTLDAELQVTVDLNLQDKRIYLEINGFNKSFADSYIFTVWNEVTYIGRNNWTPIL